MLSGQLCLWQLLFDSVSSTEQLTIQKYQQVRKTHPHKCQVLKHNPRSCWISHFAAAIQLGDGNVNAQEENDSNISILFTV